MRAKVPLEKVEQANGLKLLWLVAGRNQVFVLGHARRGARCPRCGVVVYGLAGTQQTEGLSDVLAFLPSGSHKLLLWWEVKRSRGGRSSDAQRHFRELCLAVADGVAHVVGDFDALIAWLVAHGYVKADAFPHYRQPAITTTRGELIDA